MHHGDFYPMFSRVTSFCVLAATFLLLSACHSSEPCSQYVRFDVPTQQRLIWVCTRADLKVKADPGITIHVLRMEPAHRTMSVSGTGSLSFSSHVLSISGDDISIDGYPMGNDTTATIDANGTVTMGALFHEMD
jgi:hypothetical protein